MTHLHAATYSRGGLVVSLAVACATVQEWICVDDVVAVCTGLVGCAEDGSRNLSCRPMIVLQVAVRRGARCEDSTMCLR